MKNGLLHGYERQYPKLSQLLSSFGIEPRLKNGENGKEYMTVKLVGGYEEKCMMAGVSQMSSFLPPCSMRTEYTQGRIGCTAL